eukprot:366558-Chlamydomonas_euryale.AAC.22
MQCQRQTGNGVGKGGQAGGSAAEEATGCAQVEQSFYRGWRQQRAGFCMHLGGGLPGGRLLHAPRRRPSGREASACT